MQNLAVVPSYMYMCNYGWWDWWVCGGDGGIVILYANAMALGSKWMLCSVHMQYHYNKQFSQMWAP